MSEISYFQKYSNKENHVTNNTLLMFRHLYQHNTARFEQFLNSIMADENLEIGLVFEQQVRAAESVPDGVISQKPFNLYIEAKLDGKLDRDQIKRHLQSAKEKKQSYIIGLTKEVLNENELSEYKKFCADEGVVFSSKTYTDLVRLLRIQSKEFETNLIEIIDDYEQFLLSENMITNPFRMISFPCGISWNENIKYQVYFEQAHRPSKSNVPFLGIYRNKQVTHIAKIKTACIAIYDENKELKILDSEKPISNLDKDNIINIIKDATYFPNFAEEPHRYYILEDMQEVNLTKTSSHGILGKRYFDLNEFHKDIKLGMKLSEIVDLIKGMTFE